LDWENLGFGLIETDFMYVAKCGPDGILSKGEVLPFGPIALSPSAGVLNYGQVSRESSHPV
jgi:branched-chain amino acid aminotransferase